MAETNMLTYLDIYCERAGQPGLWAEPINAVTNLAFIIAAVLAWKCWRDTREANWRNSSDIVLLIILLFAIGIGSGLWHLFATAGTMKMDVIPIVLFMNLFLLAACLRVLGLRWWGALLFWAVFLSLNAAAEKFLPDGFLNGTILYIPAYLVLVVMVAWAQVIKAVSRRLLVHALGLWTLSLVFRTIDNEVCDPVSIGTHFLWHLFNAVVLYKLLRSLILQQAAQVRGR